MSVVDQDPSAVINVLIIKQEDGTEGGNFQTCEGRVDPDNDGWFTFSSAQTVPRIEPSHGSSMSFTHTESCNLSVSLQSTPQTIPSQRLPLYKSQSFSVATTRLKNEENESGCSFNLESPWQPFGDQNTPNSQVNQTNTIGNETPRRPPQTLPLMLSTPIRNVGPGPKKKLVRHKSLSIPVNPSLSLPRSPFATSTPHSTALLLKDLKKASTEKLTATPDSGFCTPSFDNSKVVLLSPTSPSPVSTPVTSSAERIQEYDSARKESGVRNENCQKDDYGSQDDESPLDRSLESVQWLRGYSIGDTVMSLSTTPPKMSSSSMSVSHTPSSDEVHVVSVDPAGKYGWITLPAGTNIPMSMASSIPSCNSLPRICDGTQGSSSSSTLLHSPGKRIGPPVVMTAPIPYSNKFPRICDGNQESAVLSTSPRKRKALQELVLNENSKRKCEQELYAKPAYSYMDLIKMAMKHSEDGQMTLREILAWIEEHFPYFKHRAKKSWKSSVRHNLSLHADFIKVQDKKHGGKWKMVEDARKYIHRLRKPPEIKRPAVPKVPAYSRKIGRRSVPKPILPKAGVPYALVPIPIAPFTPGLGQQGTPQMMQQQPIRFPVSHFPIQQTYQQQPLSTVQLSQQPQNLPQEDPKKTSKAILPKSSAQEVANANLDSSFSSYSQNQQDGSQGNKCCQCRSKLGDKSKPSRRAENSVMSEEGDHKTSHKYVVEPVDIEIVQNSQLNEKKIVFHFKKQKYPVKQCGTLIGNPHRLMRSKSEYNQGQTISKMCPLKNKTARRLMDKMQRSNSFDVDCENAENMFHGWNQVEGIKRAPILNLEYKLKEDRRAAETSGKCLIEDDEDQALNLYSNYGTLPTSKSQQLSDSAPRQSLIEQAWIQAESQVVPENEEKSVESQSTVDSFASVHHLVDYPRIQIAHSGLESSLRSSVKAANDSQSSDHGSAIHQSQFNNLTHPKTLSKQVYPTQHMMEQEKDIFVNDYCSEEGDSVLTQPTHTGIHSEEISNSSDSTTNSIHIFPENVLPRPSFSQSAVPCPSFSQSAVPCPSLTQRAIMGKDAGSIRTNQVFMSDDAYHFPQEDSYENSSQRQDLSRSSENHWKLASFQSTDSNASFHKHFSVPKSSALYHQNLGTRQGSQDFTRPYSSATPVASPVGSLTLTTALTNLQHGVMNGQACVTSENRMFQNDNISGGSDSGACVVSSTGLVRNDSLYVSPGAGTQFLSASKLIFSHPAYTSSGRVSACSTTTTNSVVIQPSIPSTLLASSSSNQNLRPPAAQAVQPTRFYRTKSRRKQVHTPLTTGASPPKDKAKAKPKVFLDRENKILPDSHSTDRQITVSKESHKLVTPPCGTNDSNAPYKCSQTTSSPNAEHVLPLDFTSLFEQYSPSKAERFSSGMIHPASQPNGSGNIRSTSSLSTLSVSPPSHQLFSDSPSPPFSSSISAPNINCETFGVSASERSPISGCSAVSASLPMPTATPEFVTVTASTPLLSQIDPELNSLSQASFQSSPPVLHTTSPNSSLRLTPSHPLSHFMALTSTPPAGEQPVSGTVTPTHGIQLPSEILQGFSGILDNSFFDNFESMMQNSFSES